MSKAILFGIIISLICGGASYFASNNIFVCVGIFVLYLLYFLIIVNKRFKKFNSKISRFHECYYFINNFVISLNVKGSISNSLETSSNLLSEDFNDEIKGIEDLTEMEKIIYLNKYFKFSIYKLFVDVITVWSEEGGNILEMGSFVINKAREGEDYIQFCESQNRKIALEFSILWVFAIAVMIVLRIALKDYYSMIVNQVFYLVGIVIIFLVLLISIELFTRRMVSLEFGGLNNEEK